FEDGSVVLVAQNTTAFCLHKTVLSIHSGIFRDLLSIPQPEKIEQYDGRPVIHMSDSPEDLRCMVRAIYYGFTGDKYIDFLTVVSLIRIAHKYQAEQLIQQALSPMKSFFTDGL
ncbi:hypothetical protein WOLCODRAFT_47773, partial [Wolfiporia cocos MD-104 SS10]